MRIITLDSHKKVICIKTVNDNYINNPGLQTGEIISDIGEPGQIQQADGSFVTPALIPITPQPTLEDRIMELNENQLTIMEAIADLYNAIPTSTTP